MLTKWKYKLRNAMKAIRMYRCYQHKIVASYTEPDKMNNMKCSFHIESTPEALLFMAFKLQEMGHKMIEEREAQKFQSEMKNIINPN